MATSSSLPSSFPTFERGSYVLVSGIRGIKNSAGEPLTRLRCRVDEDYAVSYELSPKSEYLPPVRVTTADLRNVGSSFVIGREKVQVLR